ncbi:flt3-interacting zinc finger protein 1 [Anolis carolinensis]|uniref:Flt3-interacting zinc finger protein 1 n=1 Tax=Anolis carolinensis TaxID=28377 RepID=A0A803TJB9_ANOCA|nr:PREDICTED: flt3-interacting zinc finger protein 1 [Anolis carolinensis]|eukprot:XP_008115368.1 PREDICTED: flt3-interacting zinc finger protein 1 [Anolis carolinensis]
MENCGEVWPEGQCSLDASAAVRTTTITMERCAVLYSDVEDDPSLLTDNGMGARAPFHCSECDKSFRYRSDLRRHFARHTELKPFQCPHCVKSFKHSFNLVNHIRSHTGERPYRCTMCPKGFRDSTGLLHHQVVHTGEKPYCCPVCELRFSSRSSLGRHLKRQHRTSAAAAIPQAPVPRCLACGKEQSPLGHLCSAGRGRATPFGCGACGRHFQLASELRRHWLAHTDIKPFKCPECEKDFNAASLLERHKLTHVKGRPPPCPVCSEKVQQSDTVSEPPSLEAEPKGEQEEVKVLQHSSGCPTCRPPDASPPETLYQCDCGTFFANGNTLAAHLTAHGGEPSFTCGICGQPFVNLQILEEHQLSHAVSPSSMPGPGSELERHLLPQLDLRTFPSRPGKKLYKCSECEKYFRSPRDLDRHVLVHTGEKPYQCTECGKFFRHECYLKRHRLLHSGDRPFKCSVCHKGFITLSNLSRHVKLHRGID